MLRNGALERTKNANCNVVLVTELTCSWGAVRVCSFRCPFLGALFFFFSLFSLGEAGKLEIRESHFDGRAPQDSAEECRGVPVRDGIWPCQKKLWKTSCRHDPVGPVCGRIIN